MGLKMFAAFVLGEALELAERDGAWQWRPWARMSHRPETEYPTASEAALNAFACMDSRQTVPRDALADIIKGIAEVCVGNVLPEIERARTAAGRIGISSLDDLASLQRRTLRAFGMTHRDGVLLERRSAGLLPPEYLLAELRPGALPSADARPDRTDDGYVLMYADAPQVPRLSGGADLEIVRNPDGSFCYRMLPDGTLSVRQWDFDGTVQAAIDAARSMGAARVALHGQEWTFPGAAEYGLAYGMTVVEAAT